MSDSPILHRDIVGNELRADDGGRRVYGVVVPYNERAEINDGYGSYTEMFVRGSFARSVAERGHKIKLLAQHDRRRFPIGKATSFEEHDDGLHGEFAIPNTREGDDILELVRTGTLDSFSVGFRPIRDRRQDGIVVRAEAALNEVSLVGLPAYDGAAVAGIRESHSLHRIPRSVAERRLRLLEL
jgi:HK97 family phage prohead protease